MILLLSNNESNNMNTVNFKNQKELDSHNLNKIFTRKNGCLFYVENNKLRRMSLFQKIFYLIGRIFLRPIFLKEQLKVKNIITDLTNRIESKDKEFLTKLFFKKLSRLSEKVFDRSEINSSAVGVLRGDIENSYDVLKIKEKVDNHSKGLWYYFSSKVRKDYNYKDNNLKRFQDILIKTRLSLALGVRPVKPPGYSKTYLIKDFKDKRYISIFKPAVGDSLSIQAPFFLTRWQNRLFHKMGFGGSIYKHVAGKCYIAEKASFVVDEVLQTGCIPPTDIVSLDQRVYRRHKPKYRKGSLQLFARNAIEAKEFFKMNKRYQRVPLRAKRRISQQERELLCQLFDKLAGIDVITGNLDRHAENWLLKFDEKDRNIIKDIVLIDGGMAFSPSHGNSSWERAKQYFWAKQNFFLANRRFSKQGKEIIKKAYLNRKILYNQVLFTYVEEGDKEKIAKRRAEKMVERIEMLYYFAFVQDSKILELKNYRSKKEIDYVRNQLKNIQNLEVV